MPPVAVTGIVEVIATFLARLRAGDTTVSTTAGGLVNSSENTVLVVAIGEAESVMVIVKFCGGLTGVVVDPEIKPVEPFKVIPDGSPGLIA